MYNIAGQGVKAAFFVQKSVILLTTESIFHEIFKKEPLGVAFKFLENLYYTSMVNVFKNRFIKHPAKLWCVFAMFAIFSLPASLFAQDINKSVNDVDVFRPEKRETTVQMVDSSKNNSVKLDVNIFADGFVGSYYVLWDEVDLSEDIKKLMTTREFATDEFFMQNIDREQFEQERLLQLFEDKKREYFSIFPEEALKMLEDEHKDDE